MSLGQATSSGYRPIVDDELDVDDPQVRHPTAYHSRTSSEDIANGRPKRHIGVISATFLIFNAMVGTGVFATPSTILGLSGSVGLSFVMWIIGAIFAGAGMQVYTIWGTALPQNGGEKNYVEYLFPKPPRLIASMYAADIILIAHGAGNTLMFAEYTLAALRLTSTSTWILSPVQLVAFFSLTCVIFVHGLQMELGLRLQNLLGFAKVGILFVVVATGLVALSGNLQEGVARPGNFDNWETIWGGSKSGGSVLCYCLYNVIWSYFGYANANYALSEVQNPGRTLRIAGPLALITVTVLYLLCNVAYFAAASKAEITGSGRLVVALLFRNVWGERTERVLSAFVALSALGSMLSTAFSRGRLNQVLGRQNVLPFSKFWASSWPAGAPLAGMGLYWLVCIIFIFAIPPGDAYNFVVNMRMYPLAVVNATISFGLLYHSLRNSIPKFARSKDSQTPITSYTPLLSNSPTSHDFPPSSLSSPPIEEIPTIVDFPPTPSLIYPALLFGLSNVFLFIVPLLKPPPGVQPYEHLPYWIHAAGAGGVYLVGWLWWTYKARD